MVAPLRYPNKKLTRDDDYLQIDILECQPPGFVNNSFRQRTSSEVNGILKGSIYLPIPQNVGDSTGVDWGDDSINSVAAYGVGAAMVAMQSPDFVKGSIDAFKTTLSNIEKAAVDANTKNLVNSYLASRALNSLGANTSFEGLLSRSTGQVLNPNMELLFRGVKLRSHNLVFDIAPRDEQEANQVKQIIRVFKVEMAARSAGNGLTIKSPSTFQLQYKKGGSKHPFLYTFKPCALLNLDVDYTASGQYSTYWDGTPVHMRMTLSFQELNPVYRENYSESNASIGVGY